MTFGSIAFGFLAGVLSILSPCVLPLLPLILGAATASHRLGLPALAAEVVLSFVASACSSPPSASPSDLTAMFSAASAPRCSPGAGIVLLSAPLQTRFALATGGIGNAGNRAMAGLTVSGPSGQFVLGLLLGAVWNSLCRPHPGRRLRPCRATPRPRQRRRRHARLWDRHRHPPAGGRPAVARGAGGWRGRLWAAGQTGKRLLGATALVVSLAILTGFDRKLETILVNASPAWLTDLTTRF